MGPNHTALIGKFGAASLTTDDIAQERDRIALETFTIFSEMDKNGVITYANRLFCEISGHSLQELVGSSPYLLESGKHSKEFVHDIQRTLARKEVWHGEVCNRAKHGTLFWVATTIIPIISPSSSQIEKFIAIQFDVTDKNNLIQKMDTMSRHDPLTDLPNRRELATQFEHRMSNPAKFGRQFAVAILDVDDFKSVNDAHGQHMGDELLIQVAERIKLALRPEDVVARIGGDEFALLLSDAEKSLETISTRLLTTLETPFHIDGVMLHVSASIGIRLYGQHEIADIDQALRHAYIALYRAKSENRNCCRVFDRDEELETRRVFQLHNELREALARNEFEVHFQPIVHLASSRLIGFESLIRWMHPVRGLLQPIDFLPTIENDKLILRVGEWMLMKALDFSQTLFDANLAHMVSVNIAALHLQHPGFVELVRSLLLRHSSLPPGSLVIEITESAALTNIRTATNVILQCKKLGVKFALDDFGTGFSSLTYLRKLPIDSLKIDREFIKNILIDDEDLSIVRLVAQLSDIFGLQIVAEGIENAEQSKVLQDLNCEYGQGFGIAKPMPFEMALAWAESTTNQPTFLH